MRTSIIIPTYNEEKLLPDCLLSLKHFEKWNFEVIVADGGSNDQTVYIAESFHCRVIKCARKGRACQMNEAVAKAQGQNLVFLHADTIISPLILSKIEEYLQDRSLALGAFTCILKGNKVQWFLSSQNFLKTYFIAFLHRPKAFFTKGYRMVFGDQVMFCRKEDFDKVGGFNEKYVLMEDAELCVRMNKLGRIKQFKEKIYSSDRRVVSWGILPGYFRYLKILFWYVFIGNPGRFISKYDDGRGD